MPESIKQAVMEKINFTRQGQKDKKWQPTKEAVIYDVHYLNCKGPSKANQDFIFKRPGNHHTPKRRRTNNQAVSQLSSREMDTPHAR